MKKLVTAALLGIAITFLLALLYLFSAEGTINSNAGSPYANLLFETYKTLLTFSLVTTGGIFLKALIDRVIEKDRYKQIESNRREETRKILLKEFTTLFSEFYAIRKLYHSAISHEAIYEQKSADLKILIRQLLQKSVDLEGRYGSLKVVAITHFDLPRGEYQRKSLLELKGLIAAADTEKKLARYRLDLLGESYDDWRHALEDNRKIHVDDAFWKGYELLLAFLEKGN